MCIFQIKRQAIQLPGQPAISQALCEEGYYSKA